MTTMTEKTTPMQTDIEALQPPAASDLQGFSRDASGEFLSEKPISKPMKGEHLVPSERWTGHQLFYVFALDGLGGMAISAGVNFAIAYGEQRAV